MNQPHSTPTDLIETSTTRKIWRLLNGTARFSQFAFMFGPTGRGKTFAAKAWLRNYGNGAYIYAEPRASQAGLRRALSAAIWDDETASTSAIRKHIEQHPGFVLVVDECNHLISNTSGSGANALDSIRSYYDMIHDAGGRMGVCFIFTDYSLDRLRKCRMAAFLEQFIHRGDNHLNLTGKISRSREVAPLVQSLIPYADDALIDAAAAIGNIRSICKRITVLRELADKRGIQITAKMLAGAQAQFESGIWEDE